MFALETILGSRSEEEGNGDVKGGKARVNEHPRSCGGGGGGEAGVQSTLKPLVKG